MKLYLKWILPPVCLALLAPFTPKLDMWMASLCYVEGRGFHCSPIFKFFYIWGERFGFCVGAAAFCTWLLSFFVTKWVRWRRAALALLLTLVIGAGFIVNLGFKGYWGRPRPKQLIEFGGTQSYRP